MKRFFVPLLFLLLILAFAAIGPDAPADDPGQATEEPQAPEPPATEPESEEPPETFVPSEKLPADSAISFPVDI